LQFRDDLALRLIIKKVRETTGINFGAYRGNFVKRRLRVRMHRNTVNTFGEYLKILNSNPEEYTLLLRDLTINYTKFFRDPDVFILFKNEILKKIKSSKQIIRVWSAGCATGEEPYSIAIALLEAMQNSRVPISIKVYASDIDETALSEAKRGVYAVSKLENLDKRLIRKYFIKLSEGYSIKEEVRNLVYFKNENLLSPLRYMSLDAIFCRNVLIYFSKEAQVDIFNKFYTYLKPSGLLIIGKTESIPINMKNIFECIDERKRVYRKIMAI